MLDEMQHVEWSLEEFAIPTELTGAAVGTSLCVANGGTQAQPKPVDRFAGFANQVTGAGWH